MNKSNKEFENCLNEVDSLIKSCHEFEDYLSKLKYIYKKYEKLHDNLLIWIAEINWPYNLRPEWRSKIKPYNFKLNLEIAENSESDFLEYLKEENLLKNFKNEKYIIRPLVFNNKYSLNDRESNINKFLDKIKIDAVLYEFVSSSVELQVHGLLKQSDELNNTIKKLREDRIIIYQDLLNEIKNSDFFKTLSNENQEKLFELYRDIQIVWSEGDNCKYLEKAKQLFKPELNIKFYNGGGKNEMKMHFNYYIKNKHQIKTIFLFDSDVTKEFNSCFSLKTENIVPLKLPYNENNKIWNKGIENLFDENLFKDKYIIYSEYHKPNGDIVKRKKLRKKEFLNFICFERSDKEDFKCFIPVLNEIESFFNN